MELNFKLNKEDFQQLMLCMEKGIGSRATNSLKWSVIRGNLGNQYYEQNSAEKLDHKIAVLDHEVFPEGIRIPIETENVKPLPSMQPNQYSKL